MMGGNKVVRFLILPFVYSILVSKVVKSLSQNVVYHPKLEISPGKVSTQENYISYFMYNITNPDGFEAGEKPRLEQIGPYIYKETRKKFDVEQLSPTEMRYKLDKTWEFVPEMSEGNEETDEFNVINIPLLILSNKLSAKRLPKPFNDILIDELIEKGESLVRRNEEIGNIIYHGMNVSIYTEILSDVLQGNVPPEFADGIFALLKGKNGSTIGTFTVSTKEDDMGDILAFNNQTKLEYWNGDYCNKIDGTDGYWFRPGIKKGSILKIFYAELCRSVSLQWTGEKEYKGVQVATFSFPQDMLEDPKVKPENACFCSKPVSGNNNNNSTESTCLKGGFVDYASCKQDSPLLVSYPHFLHADQEYRDKIIGLSPNPVQHETEFLIEPKTGTIVSSTRRFQFNVKLQPLDNVELFRNTSLMIVPVFITDRTSIVPESTLMTLKEDLKLLSPKKKDDTRTFEATSTTAKPNAKNNATRLVSPSLPTQDAPTRDVITTPRPQVKSVDTKVTTDTPFNDENRLTEDILEEIIPRNDDDEGTKDTDSESEDSFQSNNSLPQRVTKATRSDTSCISPTNSILALFTLLQMFKVFIL